MKSPVCIAVVGSGYVGLVAAACFAEIGHKVFCVDNDESKIAMLQAGGVPIHEEYLRELLERHHPTSITFTTDLAGATREAQAIFIAVGTPQSGTGSADLSYVDAVASEIARSIDSYKVIVEKSTVPVYTNEWIRRVVERNGVPRELFDVASNPEFLREGTAVVDFLHTDRIVVGTDAPRAADLLSAIYEPLTGGSYYQWANSVPGHCHVGNLPPIVHVSTKAAELIKHASNSFLAVKISFMNVVANICEAVGADVQQVAYGVGLDARIGPKFLQAGVGYGGSCFPKDVAAFRYVAEQFGISFGLLSEVEKINAEQKQRFFQKVRSALWTFRGKKLGVLGLAFKGGTDDIRDSPAIEIVEKLLQEGCAIDAYDPAAMERTAEILPPSANMHYVGDAYAAAEGKDALLILTDWQEFAELDLERLHQRLRYPIILDGRNLYKPEHMASHGFSYMSVGRQDAQPGREVLVKAGSFVEPKRAI
ncbi:UDP-glucose/GDP-mannose dehydrogenase family protein [Acidipila sp. EB88]|uniref:UDP-glucose dehydrogenase family protein n=1 Tax=Acidipila sp. EB88 TaxID=2305226 RepID=UPI000F5E199E|nr:UDP-glucose/GDP-mannose dehydrogenase family protein [Acidipila sp. EB88]RRA49678.1 UDP-glucose/GDP-mannose dehydrogenase family protein [Acidipila sp. EB88]